MVTTYPPRAASLSSPWRFAELFWPNVPSPCGLDADAARLLRSTLTMAAGQMLERWRRTGAPLPPRPDLAMISQARFVAGLLPGQSHGFTPRSAFEHGASRLGFCLVVIECLHGGLLPGRRGEVGVRSVRPALHPLPGGDLWFATHDHCKTPTPSAGATLDQT